MEKEIDSVRPRKNGFMSLVLPETKSFIEDAAAVRLFRQVGPSIGESMLSDGH
jgi:hypothetical protein